MTLRTLFSRLTGYYIYKFDKLQPGVDLFFDIKNRIRLNPDVVFDVGANTGQTAVRFFNNFKNATIYSFEPFFDAFESLKKNTINFPNIKIQKIALGDKNEVLEIVAQSDSKLNSLKTDILNINGKIEQIKSVTGHLFCHENNINEIDLLKIDTEGFEIPVLQGFESLLKGNKIKLIFCEVGFSKLNKRNTYLPDLIKMLEDYDFRFYGLYEMRNKNISSANHYANALFVNKSLFI